MNLPNDPRERIRSSVEKITIFYQGSSHRFSASGRSTCFFQIHPLAFCQNLRTDPKSRSPCKMNKHPQVKP